MYTIIGADGLQYGPVPAEVLRQWLLEGRVDRATRVLVSGATEWTTLGGLPEFVSAGPAPPTISPPRAASPQVARTNSLALAGAVFGVISVTCGMCCCYGVPFNLAGLVFSILGALEIKRDPVHQQGYGLAVAGFILSLLSLLLAIVLLGLAFVFGSFRHGWNIHRL